MRFACVAAAAALAGCTTATVHQPRYAAQSPAGWGPKAELIGTDGRSIGIVQTRYGPRAWGLGLESPWDRQPEGVFPPGSLALHIHEVGRCDPPDFASAGAHWNPTGKQHGHDNPAGWHLGDLGNYEVLDGGLSFSTSSPDSRLVAEAPGDAPVVLDADGAAVILHAGPDDEKTDPSGNSGARIACAVIPPPK